MALAGACPPVRVGGVAIPGVAIAALWPIAGVVLAAVARGHRPRRSARRRTGLSPPCCCSASRARSRCGSSVEGAPSAVGARGRADRPRLLVSAARPARLGSRRVAPAAVGRASAAPSGSSRSRSRAWVVLAVLQIPLGGSLTNGFEGFRLVHFYVLDRARRGPARRAHSATSACVADAARRDRPVISIYAAFRGSSGRPRTSASSPRAARPAPSSASTRRDTGSFTSPVAARELPRPGRRVRARARLPRRRAGGLFGAAVFALAHDRRDRLLRPDGARGDRRRRPSRSPPC